MLFVCFASAFACMCACTPDCLCTSVRSPFHSHSVSLNFDSLRMVSYGTIQPTSVVVWLRFTWFLLSSWTVVKTSTFAFDVFCRGTDTHAHAQRRRERANEREPSNNAWVCINTVKTTYYSREVECDCIESMHTQWYILYRSNRQTYLYICVASRSIEQRGNCSLETNIPATHSVCSNVLCVCVYVPNCVCMCQFARVCW